MKNAYAIALALFAISCGDARERAAEDALRHGNASYREGRFMVAVERYGEALHDARVLHNSGKAAYRAKDHDLAVERLRATTEVFQDPIHQAAAFHDLGVERVMQARWADSMSVVLAEKVAGLSADETDIASRVRLAVERDSLRQQRTQMISLTDSALVRAIDAFKQALLRVPTDEDTRYNMALSQRLLATREKDRQEKDGDKDEQKELSEHAKALMAQADELVEQHRFKEALELLKGGLQKEPSLAKEKEYMDKLEVVTKAAEAT